MMEQKLFCLFVFDFFVGIYVYVRFYSVLIDVSFFTYKHAYQRPFPYEKMSFFFQKERTSRPIVPFPTGKNVLQTGELELSAEARLVSFGVIH